jgi:hypothetical protein
MGSGRFVGHVVFHVLVVLQYTTAAAVNKTELPCLCLFDVDRTLTGKQNDVHHCHNNKVTTSIHDPGFGGGPFTASQLALNLDKTFCVNCYAGLISHGSGGGSKMRSHLVNLLNNKKQTHLRVKNIWDKVVSVKGPLVSHVENAKKHYVATTIRDWYKSHMKIDIADTHTHFFDDKGANVEEFKDQSKGYRYNAHQVSCKSRDNSEVHDDHIGWCGGTVAECVKDSGVHVCPKRLVAPTGSPTGIVPAEMITAMNGPQKTSEEVEIGPGPGPGPRLGNASAVMWDGLASMEVIV